VLLQVQDGRQEETRPVSDDEWEATTLDRVRIGQYIKYEGYVNRVGRIDFMEPGIEEGLVAVGIAGYSVQSTVYIEPDAPVQVKVSE
jgi:hypothetical protein